MYIGTGDFCSTRIEGCDCCVLWPVLATVLIPRITWIAGLSHAAAAPAAVATSWKTSTPASRAVLSASHHSAGSTWYKSQHQIAISRIIKWKTDYTIKTCNENIYFRKMIIRILILAQIHIILVIVSNAKHTETNDDHYMKQMFECVESLRDSIILLFV